ncbi:MAG: DUF87 domain-containing protein [Lachnospiraceae bacterium]|nr:DUF87 domain-containing protein [Lachnospiraceae bacterium]
MLIDKEGNFIKLAGIPNYSKLLVGGSGYGKTYGVNRFIEEAVKQGKYIRIVDYSGSYTKKELGKSNFQYLNEIDYLDTGANVVTVKLRYSTKTAFCKDVTDALLKTTGIDSYYQRKWLIRAVEQHMKNRDSLYFSQLVRDLEELFEQAEYDGESKENIDNIARLLSRFYPYENLRDFSLGFVKEEIQGKPVQIIQINRLSEMERRFTTTFLLEMLWKEIQHNEKTPCYELLVLDEFQFLSLAPGSALTNMLREGRRFGLELLLSTQFVSCYSKEEVRTLFQVGSVLIFRPTSEDLAFWSKMIDSAKAYEWKLLLSRLAVGQAVLKGKYYINHNDMAVEVPIVCRIQNE